MTEEKPDRRRRPYQERSIKVLICVPRGFYQWFKRTCRKEKISVSEGFRRPYLAAWREAKPLEPMIAPPETRATPVEGTIPVSALVNQPIASHFPANQCLDCGNKSCKPSDEPCYSCNPPTDACNWKQGDQQ